MDKYLIKKPVSKSQQKSSTHAEPKEKGPQPSTSTSSSNYTPNVDIPMDITHTDSSDDSQLEDENEYLTDEPKPQDKKKQKSYKQKFRESWLKKDEFCKWLVKNSNNEPYCKLCNRTIHGGITHLNRHAQSKMHQKKIKNATELPKVSGFFNKKKEAKLSLALRTGELKLIGFIAEHNLALSTLDHLPKLIASICPDSEIAKRLKLSRKKGTKLMKEVISNEQNAKLSKMLSKLKFSLIIDETTDVSTSKCLVLVVRLYDDERECVDDKFWALLRVRDCSAQGIFDVLEKHFSDNNVPLDNLIGFAVDNAAVMMGAFNGVQAKLQQKVPDLYVLGCSCHSLHLCSAAACQHIPDSVEELTRDIYGYFAHSSKRLEAFEEFQSFANVESHKILKPCQTRWLSLESVIKRILEQWPALILFFRGESDVENVAKAKPILSAMNNVVFKLYFQFLAFILEIVNKINIEFQSEKYKFHVLLPRIKALFLSILKFFMKADYIDRTEIDKIIYHPNHYLEISNIYIGAKVEMELLQSNVNSNDLLKLRTSCLNFYVTLCKQVQKRFKFNDDVLCFATNLDPKIATENSESVVKMYLRFKQKLSGVDIEQLSTEWRSLKNNETILKNREKSVEEFWTVVFNMENGLDEKMFPNLTCFVKLFLTLPHSSAAAERVFSQVSLIKTKNRNRLDVSTCEALLHTKELVSNVKCYDFEPPRNLLSRNISVDVEATEEMTDLLF